MTTFQFHSSKPKANYTLVIHAGAGNRTKPLTAQQVADYESALGRAYSSGNAVLAEGGCAVDAVCAAVVVLEDEPLFNAGRGSVLPLDGGAQLDACLMDGSGSAGAIVVSRFAKNPILLARHVQHDMHQVLIADPSPELCEQAGVEVVDPSYFETPERLAQRDRIRDGVEQGSKHGTVGAVALDSKGHMAAATSTGGVSIQISGRVGDSPIVGAGTFARDGGIAISCTGEGEAFMQGVVSHDIFARMKYGKQAIELAAEESLLTEVAGRDAVGGLIAVTPDGGAHVALISDMIFAAMPRSVGEGAIFLT